MNITFQLAVVAVAACLCVAEGAPDGRLGRAKQQRPTRGFKNVEMMTARGFGKRDRPATRSERDVDYRSPPKGNSQSTPTFKSETFKIARDFGKRDPEMEQEIQDRYVVAAHKKFNPKSMGLLVAKDFGKRTDNGDLEEDTGLREKKMDFEPASGYFVGRGYGKRDLLLKDNEDSDMMIKRTVFESNSGGLGARGFGKRGLTMKNNEGEDDQNRSIRTQQVKFNPETGLLIARGPGKRESNGGTDEVYNLDNFWEMLENAPEREGQDNEEKTLESIPVDWLVSEMLNNPEFARSVVRKFVDLNQDGILSSEELLRNVV